MQETEANKMIDNAAVGKTIAKLRQNKNMTQQQLAAALGVSHQAVSKWETGAALPDVQTLIALTRLFGITIEQLLEGDVPEDRVEPPKPASPFEEPIQNIGNFVNNIVESLFRQEKSAAVREDDGAADAETGHPEGAGEDADQPAGEEGSDGEDREPFDARTLLQMAPYMSKSAVDEILLQHRQDITLSDIARFAPFASQECLEQLISDNDENLDWNALKKVAPFLKREMVDDLARQVVQGQRRFRQTPAQGIDSDELCRAMQDVGQRIGEGMEKALRRAGQIGSDVVSEVTTAINSFASSAQERQARADALRRAACERALEDEKWDWLAVHIPEIKDEELLRRIAQKANSLGMHDWVLENLNGYADTRTIDAAIEDGNWGWLGDHVWQFEDELQEKIALEAAKRENWQWLSIYAEQISLEHCADEIAILAYKADARVLAGQIARHCMNPEQRGKFADTLVAAGDFDFLYQLRDVYSPEELGAIMVETARAGNWEPVKPFVESIDQVSLGNLMELAIGEGNFEVVDLLDPYL